MSHLYKFRSIPDNPDVARKPQEYKEGAKNTEYSW